MSELEKKVTLKPIKTFTFDLDSDSPEGATFLPVA